LLVVEDSRIADRLGRIRLPRTGHCKLCHPCLLHR